MKYLKDIFLNERLVISIAILNAIIIFIGGFPGVSPIFLIIDNLLTIFFITEVIIKINTYSLPVYWQSKWNRFDFIVTILAAPSLLSIISADSASSSFSVILSLRVLRIFKLFRTLKFIPNITGLLKGIHQAIKSSVLVIIAFAALTLSTSIITCALFGTLAPEYFNNPLDSLYTTFRLFSVEGWYEIPDLIAERSSLAMGIFAKLYFSILLFCGGIIGLSLVNSIFVDAMMSDNNDEVLEKLKILENKIDNINNNGL